MSIDELFDDITTKLNDVGHISCMSLVTQDGVPVDSRGHEVEFDKDITAVMAATMYAAYSKFVEGHGKKAPGSTLFKGNTATEYLVIKPLGPNMMFVGMVDGVKDVSQLEKAVQKIPQNEPEV